MIAAGAWLAAAFLNRPAGYCTCAKDFPGRYPVPPPGATWHYLCERPVEPGGTP